MDVYGVTTNCDVSHTLEENLMSCGAMDVLISDNASATTSQKVKDILHMYHIKSCTCEPHHQHQNYAKYCIGHIKDIMNHILTFTSAPSNPWLLCLMYDVYIFNITPNNSIGNISPHHYLYGQTPDISPTLCFCFYEPVYYLDTDSFPAPVEKRGDGLVLPPMSGIFSPSESLQMTHIALSITLLYGLSLSHMKRTFVLNSLKGKITLINQ